VNVRRRNWVLLWVSLIGILFFLRVWPVAIRSPAAWDWRAVAEGPFADAVDAPPQRLQPVRLLGRGPGAIYGAEVLHAAGLLGVAAGAPPSHANARSEVLLVPAERCAGAASLQAHLDAGGAVVLIAPCDALRVALDVPEATPWAEPAPEASVDLSAGRRARNLPLPPLGADWQQPAGWEALARRVDGGVVVMQRGRLVATSIDLIAWLRTLRQGDPELANVDRDGDGGLTTADLQPFPWSGLAWRQPSADAWAELLAWIVGERLPRHPLPRIWPLPGGARSALILTVEQGLAGPEAAEAVLARAEALGSEGTLFTGAGGRQEDGADADGDGGELPSAKARAWGHGVGAQPNLEGLGDPRLAMQAIAAQRRRLEQRLDGAVRAARLRRTRWWGHDAPTQHLAALGAWIDLDLSARQPRHRGPGFAFGARPLRWQGPTGAMLPILAQPVPLDGEDGRTLEQQALAATNLLDAAATWAVPLAAALPGTTDIDLVDSLLLDADDRGLPILSAERWATWSWARLRAVEAADVSPTPTGWTVAPLPAEVPLLLWTPGDACDAPIAPSPLSGPGCLGPAGG
jgi:hypothetical protein